MVMDATASILDSHTYVYNIEVLLHSFIDVNQRVKCIHYYYCVLLLSRNYNYRYNYNLLE